MTDIDADTKRPATSRDSFAMNDHPEARRITKADTYFTVYDRYFDGRRDRPIVMLEIGVQHGGSLEMWKRFFHPGSLIAGIDINPDCAIFEEPGVRVFIGDQSDESFLAHVLQQIGQADIILDDGSHIPRHQIASFEYLFRHGLKEGGVYIVEDCATSYWPRYGGGRGKRGTFIEYSKQIADAVNQWHSEGQVKHSWHTDWVESIEFTNEMVSVRKRHMVMPSSVIVGGRMLDLDNAFATGKHAKLVLFLKQIPFIQRLVRTNPLLWNMMKRFIRRS